MTARTHTPGSVILMLLATSAQASAAANETTERLKSAATEIFAAEGVSSNDGPGCSVSVKISGSLVFEGGYGLADIERKVPFTEQTVSETGSVAKQFTAASILMLAEQGKLSLEDDIRKYLPELPDYGKTITIYNLIHHTSGLREWSILAALRGSPRHYRKIYALDDVFNIVASQRNLNFAPGDRFQYNNSNYALLTIILERVSGLSSGDFGQKYLFGPLGMNSTQWRDDLTEIVPDRALAYRSAPSGFQQSMPMENVYGHGALLTTVGDMQRWNQAMMNGGLSTFVTEHMLAPGTLNSGAKREYGGGLRVDAYRGHKAFRHGGNTAGYTAQLWAFPEERTSVALLCNTNAASTDRIAARMADIALGLEMEAKHPESAVPDEVSEPIDAKASYFQSADGEIIAIISEGGKTLANFFTHSGYMLMAAGDKHNDFVATTRRYGTFNIQFADSDHIVANLSTREPSTFVRMTPSDPTIDVIGQYWSSELGVAYAVTMSGQGLRMDLLDRDADDQLGFRLEWLNANSYLARIESDSGYIRDDVVVNFSKGKVKDKANIVMSVSAVAGLQGISELEFVKTQVNAKSH